MDMHALLEEYEQNHQLLACRVTHAIGIPLIALSFPLVLINPRRALKYFVAGWTLQFVEHAFEGKLPTFFEGYQYLLAGLVWWSRMATAPIRALAGR